MTLVVSEKLEPGALIDHESYLKRHTAAVRDNQITVLAILQFLFEEPPNASAAREALQECEQDVQTDLWSQSPKAGGIWQTWQRDALKYGDIDLTNSYNVHRQRTGQPPILENCEIKLRDRTMQQANDRDLSGWFTVTDFAKQFPNEIRSVHVAYRLASQRAFNGLEAAGACVKKPGRPVMFNRANYERWQQSN